MYIYTHKYVILSPPYTLPRSNGSSSPYIFGPESLLNRSGSLSTALVLRRRAWLLTKSPAPSTFHIWQSNFIGLSRLVKEPALRFAWKAVNIRGSLLGCMHVFIYKKHMSNAYICRCILLPNACFNTSLYNVNMDNSITLLECIHIQNVCLMDMRIVISYSLITRAMLRSMTYTCIIPLRYSPRAGSSLSTGHWYTSRSR